MKGSYQFWVTVIGVTLGLYTGGTTFTGKNDLSELADRLEQTVKRDAAQGRITIGSEEQAIQKRLDQLVIEMEIPAYQMESRRNQAYLNEKVSWLAFKASLLAHAHKRNRER